MIQTLSLGASALIESDNLRDLIYSFICGGFALQFAATVGHGAGQVLTALSLVVFLSGSGDWAAHADCPVLLCVVKVLGTADAREHFTET